MAKWINRSLVQAPRNGTTSHTITFTAASAGNLLVLVMDGAVTHTVPTGWTRRAQALNNTELSVYTKTATAGESSFSTTHNGSDYPIVALVYEFPSGSAWVNGVSGQALSHTGPNPTLSGLTGTNLLFGAIAETVPSGVTYSDTVWTGPAGLVEDVDVGAPSGTTDGYGFSLAYVENSTATSFAPTGSANGTGLVSKEALTFAVNVAFETLPITETWTGTNGAAWPARWTTTVAGATGSGATIQANAGRITFPTASAYAQGPFVTLTSMAPVRDADVTATVTFPVITERYASIMVRAADNASTGYGIQLYPHLGDQCFGIIKWDQFGAADVLSDQIGGSWAANVGRKVRVQAIGDLIRVKIWDASGSEPAAWTATATDTDYSAVTGRVALHNGSGNTTSGSYVQLDDLTVRVPNPPIATLTDDFATKDTAKWWWDAAAAVSGGQLVLQVNSGYTGTIGSGDRYNLTGSSATVEVVTAPNVGNGSTELQLIAHSSVNDEAFFLLSNGFLNATVKAGGTNTGLATFAYSATSHRWWRIREAAGVIFWETSPDRTTWTIRGQWTATWPPTNVEIQLSAGYWGTEPAPGSAVLDNFNLPGSVDTTAPTVPAGVTATANSSTQVTVSWTASTDAVGVASYRVRRGGVDVAGATAVTGTSAVVTGLTASTAYSFTVSAVDAAGNRSAESTAATVTTPAAADTTAPTVPTGVTATANSSKQVTISWTASTDAVGVASYRVRRGGVNLPGATAVTGTFVVDTSVVASTAYSYTVSAVDAAGNRSAESTAATVTTPAPPPIPPAPTLPPSEAVPDWAGEPRRMTVSVYTGDYKQRLGQVPDYISCSVTWQHLGVGPGELVVGEDDPIAPYLLGADGDVVPVVVDLGTIRWSGRVSTVTLDRDGPLGSGTLTATLVDEWAWLQRMLASQNGANTSLTAMPQFDTRTGPAVSVAADYINAAATRLAVPVKATKPTTDTSPSVTLKARMTPLSDLLAAPLKAAGVTMTAQIWLPGDPQPPDIGTALSVPTVVFRPQVLADKPWLQWTDAMTNIDRMTFQANQPTAYRVVVGLSGTDAARTYDQVIDTVRRTDIGSFGLPEIYADASDAASGPQSQNAGREALAETGGIASASFQVADADPWTFGSDYIVGDVATLVVNGATWRQRVSKVTARDDRDGGLVFTPVIGDQSPDVTGDDMMVRALARVAEGLRTLQAGR